jgi:hypothetical protein
MKLISALLQCFHRVLSALLLLKPLVTLVSPWSVSFVSRSSWRAPISSLVVDFASAWARL